MITMIMIIVIIAMNMTITKMIRFGWGTGSKPTSVPCWDDGYHDCHDYHDYGDCNDDNDYHGNGRKTHGSYDNDD